MSDLIHIPEFDMTIDELHAKLESLAEHRAQITNELCNLDAEISMISAIMTVKAMREMGT